MKFETITEVAKAIREALRSKKSFNPPKTYSEAVKATRTNYEHTRALYSNLCVEIAENNKAILLRGIAKICERSEGYTSDNEGRVYLVGIVSSEIDENRLSAFAFRTTENKQVELMPSELCQPWDLFYDICHSIQCVRTNSK